MTAGAVVVYVVIPAALLTAWAVDRYRTNRADQRANHTFTRPPR